MMDFNENPGLDDGWGIIGYWKIVINQRLYYFHTYHLGTSH